MLAKRYLSVPVKSFARDRSWRLSPFEVFIQWAMIFHDMNETLGKKRRAGKQDSVKEVGLCGDVFKECALYLAPSYDFFLLLGALKVNNPCLRLLPLFNAASFQAQMDPAILGPKLKWLFALHQLLLWDICEVLRRPANTSPS